MKRGGGESSRGNNCITAVLPDVDTNEAVMLCSLQVCRSANEVARYVKELKFSCNKINKNKESLSVTLNDSNMSPDNSEERLDQERKFEKSSYFAGVPADGTRAKEHRG